MSYKIEIIKTNLELGEAPHWVANEKSLYITDIFAGRILKIDTTKNNKITSIVPQKNTLVSFVLPVEGKPGQFVIGSKMDIVLIHWDGVDESAEKCQLKVLATIDAGRTLNDGKVDAHGRVWTGSIGEEENGVTQYNGKLYVYDGENQPRAQMDKIALSNGLAWSLDNKIMYFIDSLKFTVDAMDYNLEKGEVANRRVIFDLKKNNIEGMADGMTIDNEGMLWVAVFNGAQMLRIDPKASKVIDRIQLPAYNITSATFGGANHDELWVTSSYYQMTPEQRKMYPESGNVFRITGLGLFGKENTEARI